MEAASLAAGVGRVKFATHHRGPTTAAGLATPAAWVATVAPLLRALDALAVSGCAPVLPDGATGGNGAVVDGAGGLLVSRSAKTAGVALTPADVVRVVSFDAAAWAAEYETPPVGVGPPSPSPLPPLEADIGDGDGGGDGGGGGGGTPRPTSDTPLLWAALMSPPGAYGWPSEAARRPTAALHGHALETPAAAAAAGIPLSPEETLFSTPADVAAAARVWAAHPFPGEEVWVRRGHGWFAVAGGEAAEDGAAGVVAVMRRRVLPFMGGGEGGGARPGHHPLAGEVGSAHR